LKKVRAYPAEGGGGSHQAGAHADDEKGIERLGIAAGM